METNSMALAFYIAAFLTCATCIIYTLIQNRTDKLQKKFYLSMLIILALNTVSEFVVEIMGAYRNNPVIPTILSLCKYFYFILHSAMLVLLGYYVLSITGRFNSLTKIRNFIFLIPVGLIEILLISNPIHHWCYHYDSEGLYHRGWGVTALYIISAFYILFFALNIFSSWKAITTKRRIALAYFIAMTAVGIIIQMLFIRIRVELFAESIAYLGLILTIEDEADLLNTDVGIYNRKALSIDVDNVFANKQKAYVACIKVINYDVVRRSTGSSDSNILSSLMLKELVKFLPRYYIYQTSPDTFALVLVRKYKDKANELINNISKRFDKELMHNHISLLLQVTIMLALIPVDLSSNEEVFNMLDSTIPQNHKKIMVGKDDLGFLLRRKDVESAIQRGLTNGGFVVKYQPTYSLDGLKVHGCEALVRLNDERLGNIMPDEFIPFAEQIGLIGDIDDFVLSSVCKFIETGVPKSLGINSINVNLSVVQCTKPDFVKHIIDIVNKYNIDRSQVNFEITESVDANDYEVMTSVINELKRYGFKVYMDDYGTGYSNVQSLFSMGFDIVKIDKSLLWGAEESELGLIILENNIRMLRQMKLGILVEGVETEKQLNLLQRLGVDYLQGFLFSKPIFSDELIEKLKK